MRRRAFLTLATASLASLAGLPRAVAAAAPIKITGPYVHGNLAAYFIHGESRPGPVPLTLQEALVEGRVTVRETGNVNELVVENHGADDVFIQSGDIVKGGKQDRVLTVSLIVPGKSGPVSIAAYCVEEGRWSPRGGERSDRFSSADAALPSRDAKLAMNAPIAGSTAMGRAETGQRQSLIWKNVAGTQDKLGGSLKARVTAPESRTSLQLALENAKLKEALAAYVAALQPQGLAEADILGFVFAINGRINSADLYPSNGLFRKMWPKLLGAAATEAIGERGSETAAAAPPTAGAVRDFLSAAEAGRAERKALSAENRREARESETAYFFETERAGKGWVHRNYLMR